MGVIRDTQIVSRYIKNRCSLPSGRVVISSVTAGELLEVHSAGQDFPNFYPQHFDNVHLSILPGRLSRFSKMPGSSGGRGMVSADKIVLNFGEKYPEYVEYGSLAMARLINRKDRVGFKFCVAHLARGERARRVEVFDRMLEIDVRCVPLRKETASLGMDLLSEFKYQPKANVRNTINDVLILATASRSKFRLHTDDNLLQRFSASLLGASILESDGDLMIDFSRSSRPRKGSLDSKGYVNNGWAVIERKR